MVEALAVDLDALPERPRRDCTDGVDRAVSLVKRNLLGALDLGPEHPTLKALRANYDATPALHNGVTWEEAEAALLASPWVLDDMTQLLTREGRLTVVGEDNGEILFAETSLECPGLRSIVYDRAAEDLLQGYQRETCKGNAMELATTFRAQVFSPELYDLLRAAVPGLDAKTWTWLLADQATRNGGHGTDGSARGSAPYLATDHTRFRGVRLWKGVRRVNED